MLGAGWDGSLRWKIVCRPCASKSSRTPTCNQPGSGRGTCAVRRRAWWTGFDSGAVVMGVEVHFPSASNSAGVKRFTVKSSKQTAIEPSDQRPGFSDTRTLELGLDGKR